MANIASDAGATTRVGWGAALVANPPTNGAANIFYNAYGAYLQQPTGATARNYALYVAGGSLYNNSQIINALLPSVTATDATMAAGSNILTSASSNFLTTVAVGAVITVTGAGPNGGTLKSIVTGVTDDTHLTLLDNAVGAVAASTYIADGKPVGILFLGSGAADNTVLFRPLDDAKGIQIKSQIGTVWATFSSTGVKFNSTVSMDDSAAARLIEVGTVNGSRIGTAASKIGFYGAAPVARPFGVPNAATDLPTVIALANDLRAKMLTLGLTT
jgi:hypothetical protein